MKKPKLKLGRPVLAGDTEPLLDKGKYLYPGLNGHYILSDNNQKMCWYRHVKIDLTAEPMNGDEVEALLDDKWSTGWRYIGRNHENVAPRSHIVEQEGEGFIEYVKEVRHPQQSKRERVRELIESNLFSVDTMIDQIDYIYKEEP